jgi:6-phosphogluconolactonase (cycloisomerase 2 family)
VQRSADGRHVYLANRGYDTIACFNISGGAPVLAAEVDAGVAWPQHMLVDDDRLLVAGWDSSSVASLPLREGIPSAPQQLLECAGAAWLLAGRS